jgi:hypothetical protein
LAELSNIEEINNDLKESICILYRRLCVYVILSGTAKKQPNMSRSGQNMAQHFIQKRSVIYY